MKSTFYIILLLLISLSCRKKDIDIPFDEIQGDYEWLYSYNDIGDSYAFDAANDKYGIRMTKNGRVQLFKNGTLEENYRIIRTSNIGTFGISIAVKKKDDSIYFILNGDTLSTMVYPYSSYQNYYVKKK